MKKCLITGSEGFIGSNLLNDKRLDNYIVYTFTEKAFFSPSWRTALENVIKTIDVIFHIGAVSSTDAKDINNTMFLNYEFSKILFDLAARYDKKVIYSSSAAIYGNGDEIPKNLYAWTKKTSEDYGLIKVKNFISLRYFNVYGPGENHKRKMASVANQAYFHNRINKDIPFKLFPQSPSRDFVYIKDIVNSNLFCAENNVDSGIYDVGTGESRTFENVLDLLNIKYSYLPKETIPDWYQFNTCANKNKFVLNWKPEYNLERGIKEYKEYLDDIHN